MKKKKRMLFIIICVLVLIECTSVFLMYKSSNNKNTSLDNVKYNDIKENSGIAIMIEQSDGTYVESEESIWPKEGYKYNYKLSGCIDGEGNALDNVLTYYNGNVNVKTKTNTSCYIYFNIFRKLSELCESNDNLASCLTTNNEKIDSLNDEKEGGIYRYQGTHDYVNDNYICFGTEDKEKCLNDPSTYMYRIIGVNESGQLKLIKKESLNETMQWYTENNVDISWPNSTVYTSINGSGYLTNTAYVPEGWEERISETTWKYGTPGLTNYSAKEMYEIENAWTDTTTAKVGLMVLSDYYYAQRIGGHNCSTAGGVYAECTKGWISIVQNMESPILNREMTMLSYFSSSTNEYGVRNIYTDGKVWGYYMAKESMIRPVFYLNADEKYISGDGLIDDPIMLEESDITAPTMIVTGEDMVVKDGLLRYYNAYNNTGIGHGTGNTWKDLSGNYDAKVTNANWNEKYMSYNSSSENKTTVMIGQINDLTAVTLEAYIYVSTHSSVGTIIGNPNGKGTFLQVTVKNTLIGCVYIEGNSSYTCIESTDTINDSITHVVSMTYDGNVLKLYVNGVLENALEITGTIVNPTNNTEFAIGCNPNGNICDMEYFNGAIYSARIYNRALTENEIKQNVVADRINIGSIFNSEEVTLSYIASEPISDFTADDITIENGTKGELAKVNDNHYTLSVTGIAGSTTMKSSVPIGSFKDLSGNLNTVAVTTSNYRDVTGQAPSSITVSNTSPKVGETVTYTITFGEGAFGVSKDDITISEGATLGTFTKVSSTQYTQEVTYTTNGTKTFTLQANAGHDPAGNLTKTKSLDVTVTE